MKVAGHAPSRTSASPWSTTLGQWIRHHMGAMVATGVDFIVMITCVEVLGFHPVAGTVVGALSGAATSFFLGRHWVFHGENVRPAGQFVRYALVAGASLGLNALGEYLLVVRAGLGYVLARALIAVTVSNLWNYPMHKFFVFRASQKP